MDDKRKAVYDFEVKEILRKQLKRLDRLSEFYSGDPENLSVITEVMNETAKILLE